MQPQGALPFKSWYLVYTKPRQEDVALENLLRQGYGAYLPRAREMRKRNGRRVAMVGPLFPRYLFIQLDTHTDNWGPIRSTVGVVSLVRFGQESARVPDELIDFIKTREGKDGLHDWAEPELVAGDRVHIVEGVFEGYESILVAKAGRERVTVLLDILGRQIRMHVAMDRVEQFR